MSLLAGGCDRGCYVVGTAFRSYGRRRWVFLGPFDIMSAIIGAKSAGRLILKKYPEIAMFKKVLQVVALLCLSVSLSLLPGVARAAEPDGVYSPSGPMVLKLKVPGIIHMSVSSPNVGVLGGVLGLAFEFDSPAVSQNNFVMTINNPLDSSTPIRLHGTWSMLNSSKFAVDMNFQELIALVEPLGGTVTITGNSFNGKVLASGNIKGAYGLGVRIAVKGVTIKLEISGSYIGKPVVMTSSQMGDADGFAGRAVGSSKAITLEQFMIDLVEKVRQQSIH